MKRRKFISGVAVAAVATSLPVKAVENPFKDCKQKFIRGMRVRVAKENPPWRKHFPCDCDAIVVGSYADQYSGGSDAYKQYTLLIKHKPGELASGKIWSQSSWYDEELLTLIDADRDKGELLIQENQS